MLSHQTVPIGLVLVVAIVSVLAAVGLLYQGNLETLPLPALMVFAAICVTLFPELGLYAFLILSPIKNVELGRGPLSVTRFLGFGVASLIVVRSILRRRPLHATGLEAPMALIVIGMSLSLFRSEPNDLLVAETVLSMLSLYGIVFVVVNMVENEAQLKRLVVTLLVSALYPIGVATSEWVGTPHRLTDLNRISGTFSGASGLGGFLILIVVLVGALIAYRGVGRLARVALIALFVAALLALLFTFSRSAWLGAAAGVGSLGFFLLRRSGPNRGGRFAPVLLFLFVFATVLPFWSLIDGRLIDPVLDLVNTGESTKSVHAREADFRYGFKLVLENNLIGSGIGHYGNTVSALKGRDVGAKHLVQTSHNVLVYFFAEVGIIGALGFCWLVLRITRRALSYRRRMMIAPTGLVPYVYLAAVSSLIGYVGPLIFLNGLFTNEMWVAVALMIVTTRLADRYPLSAAIGHNRLGPVAGPGPLSPLSAADGPAVR